MTMLRLSEGNDASINAELKATSHASVCKDTN